MAHFARVRWEDGTTGYGRLEGETLHLLDRAPWLGGVETGRTVDRGIVTLLAPVEPRLIICVGRNYRAHAKELGHDVPAEPMLFFKPTSSILAPGETIVMPRESQRVDHEGEIGVVIGRGGRRIPRSEALAHVFGVTCVNDVTARDLQKTDGQWARAKGFDTFCPVGPVVATGLAFPSLRVTCAVDGLRKQEGHASDMIFSVEALIAYISDAFTLSPGDLIVTGTPEGVSPLSSGCVVSVEVSGVGVLSNPVLADAR